MTKKTKNIISVIVFLVVLAFIAYYFLPKDSQISEDPYVNFFEFKIMKQDLADWEIEKYTESFAATKQSLEENPDQLDGWLQLGMLKKYIGDYKGAEAAWLKANEVRPENSTSFHNLADLYINFIKEYDKAEPMYRQAIENSLGEAKNSMFYYNFHYFYKDYLKDDKKAEEILLEGIENNPKSSDLLALLGTFYQRTDQASKAIEYYQKVLELNPDNEAIKRELDELLAK